jgi:hypothetical protein
MFEENDGIEHRHPGRQKISKLPGDDGALPITDVSSQGNPSQERGGCSDCSDRDRLQPSLQEQFGSRPLRFGA